MAGYVMMKAGRYGMALNLYQRCDAVKPDSAGTYNNMGMCLEEIDPDAALECFNRARELDPDNHHAMINTGLSELRHGNPQACLDWCDRALAVSPDSYGAYENRAQGNLMLRNWRAGWKDYQVSLGVTRQERDYGLPVWDGQSSGQVVVYGEQGLGDEILFASCIPDLMRTNDVIIDCDRRLQGVFARSFGCPVYGTRFETNTPLLDEHKPDYQIAIGTLPLFYRNSDDSFPGSAYLTPDPDRCIQWRALLDTLPHCTSNAVMKKRQTKGRTIGLAWQGGNKNTQRSQRSFDLDTFAPLFDLPHTFISLEYDEPDLKGYPIRHYGRAVNKGVDYDETLALINELDLVICVTTTAVHAAGALGKECWCLVPKYPSYRFHLDGGIPWHDSVTLVRQTDTWENVVLEVREMLEAKWSASSLAMTAVSQ